MKKKFYSNINNQKYIRDLIKQYPKISSGRKNFNDQNIRIIKNILLTKAFNLLSMKKFFQYSEKMEFFKEKKLITLKFKNKN